MKAFIKCILITLQFVIQKIFMDKLAINGGKPTREHLLVFGRPFIGDEEILEVTKTLRSGWIGTGPKTELFENQFAKYVGAKYAIATNSCTAALHLSLLVADIGLGDEVITTPMTFAATAAAIIHTGAKPVFVDIERNTMNIDVSKLEEKITKKTKAIIPVDFAGRPANLDAIKLIAKKHKLFVIEDAAHAIGASYHTKKIGVVSDMTCFSFQASKAVTTIEGGMVTTNNRKFAEKIKLLRQHGLDKDGWNRYTTSGASYYKIIQPGFKYNMTDVQASLGIHQLKRLEKDLQIRKKIWSRYDKAFKDLPVTTPTLEEPHTRHALYLYTVLLQLDKLTASRDIIRDALYHENIGTGIHFVSLHLHPYYKKKYKYRLTDFPVAADISQKTLSLPIYPNMSKQDIDDVISAVRKVINYYLKKKL